MRRRRRAADRVGGGVAGHADGQGRREGVGQHAVAAGGRRQGDGGNLLVLGPGLVGDGGGAEGGDAVHGDGKGQGVRPAVGVSGGEGVGGLRQGRGRGAGDDAAVAVPTRGRSVGQAGGQGRRGAEGIAHRRRAAGGRGQGQGVDKRALRVVLRRHARARREPRGTHLVVRGVGDGEATDGHVHRLARPGALNDSAGQTMRVGRDTNAVGVEIRVLYYV